MPAGHGLGIQAQEYWAYRRNQSHPLQRVLIIDPGRHYDAEIRIRFPDSPALHEFYTRRSKLPCKWEDREAYLEAHPEVPRGDEVATPVEPVHIVHTTNELRAIIHEEVRNAFGVEKVAFNVQEAAIAVGLSPSSIQNAVRRNELVPRYYGNRPLFTSAELLRWVDSLPDSPVRRSR
ncbi:hypothetical protein [Microbacterium sp. T2.11-28]|uniref:hypothetical protein n=1 Tax=Microbacterium sp. T2.11-28 TaxID=3041169 RepID=UPI00247791C6|nr:hypothetical protein [Microbacterium sp. T2.11-28]CAI9386098.1 hypothetical protein MICABA_00178 [Microbacterium sp. T2.11-28]